MTLREVNRVGEGQKNVPKLRFKGYEDAWEQRMLPDFVEFYNGQTYTPADVQEFGTLVLRSSNIRNGEVIDADNVYINSEKATAEQVKEGDIIVVVRNGSRALIGKHAEIKENMPNTVIGAFMTGLRSGQPSFLNALLETTQFEQEIEKNMGATINQITGYMFSKMSFMTTGENEQEAVGNYFKEIDNLITLHQRKYDALKTMKKTLLSKMFPKDGEDVPEIRFKGFTDAWEQRKLGEEVQIVMGQSPKGENYTDNPEDYILVQGNADMKDGKVFPRVWTTQVTKQAHKGDIILSVRAPVGDIGKTNYDVVIGRGVAAVKGNEFFYQLLGKLKLDGYWTKSSTGSTFDSINSNEIKNAKVTIPDTNEQLFIGDYFQGLDNLITLHQRKLDELKNIKKTLLQQMFV